MKKLQNISAFVFIACVVILTVVSILGVWKILEEDVITKSIQTVSLLALVTIVIIITGKFFDSHNQSVASGDMVGATAVSALEINPAFTSIRYITLTTLIISLVILALLGVLSIWDVLSGQTLSKSLSSMTIIAFSSIIIIMTCLQREQHKLMQKKISGWAIFGMVIIGWILLATLL